MGCWEDMNVTISMPSLVPTDDKIVKYENSFGPRVQELLEPWVLIICSICTKTQLHYAVLLGQLDGPFMNHERPLVLGQTA